MAFTESGNESSSTGGSGDGLPMEWKNLLDTACPKCRDELYLFDHVRLYKCRCGFKISMVRFKELRERMENPSGGYFYGNYDDETPF